MRRCPISRVSDNNTDKQNVHPSGSLPDTDAILAQMERVLSSSEFAQSERLQKFLKFIVNETLAGRAGNLKEFTIALDVFGRDDSFDPQTSSIVRVEASRLRAKLDKYNAIEGLDDPIHISVPTGHYVPVFVYETLLFSIAGAYLSK